MNAMDASLKTPLAKDVKPEVMGWKAMGGFASSFTMQTPCHAEAASSCYDSAHVEKQGVSPFFNFWSAVAAA